MTDGAGHVVRTVPGLTAPSWTYQGSLQVADFGAAQPAYTINLYQLSALTPTGTISPIGTRMAALPLPAKLSRALIASDEGPLSVTDEIIDIIACLSVENVFLSPSSEERKEAAALARRGLYRREGDHLTLLATLRAYAAENADRRGWCERHFVSHRAMRSVMDVRKQLRGLCRLPAPSSSSLGSELGDDAVQLSPERSVAVLKAFLTGFMMNTARLVSVGEGYRTIVGNQTVGLHPSSVLFGRKGECVMYNEFVFTNKAYARGCSVVQLDWVQEMFEKTGKGVEEGA